MRNGARVTDIFYGKCRKHSSIRNRVTGIIITGSHDVSSNNLGTARLSDIVISNCKHIGIIITCSPDVYVNNLGLARIYDLVYGHLKGMIITGSSDILSS
ncbi:MAG: hypothetical protein PHD05_00280 [Sphaerochaetaceae bacterium]|jgi:uncharacterized Zn-binding protein involved in type VI secretion|nr:hypothetical protein [Sphaerochaetaceae bacterium]